MLKIFRCQFLFIQKKKLNLDTKRFKTIDACYNNILREGLLLKKFITYMSFKSHSSLNNMSKSEVM